MSALLITEQVTGRPISGLTSPGLSKISILTVWKLSGAEQWGKSNSLRDRIPPTYGHRLYRQSLCISTANQVEMPRFQLEASRCLAWEWIGQEGNQGGSYLYHQ